MGRPIPVAWPEVRMTCRRGAAFFFTNSIVFYFGITPACQTAKHLHLRHPLFLGIALTFLAVAVVGRAVPSSATRSWQIVSIALFLCALPMFYHFEWRGEKSPAFWGLMAGFLAGLAALSASAAMYGGIRKSGTIDG
jgi:heme/copper-type cytochrome/quinol oxidase subunit 4